MPHDGVASTETGPGCAGQLVLRPRTQVVLGRPAPSKMRSITLVAGVSPRIEWDMRDPDGLPVSLEHCVGASLPPLGSSSSSEGASASPAPVKLRVAESIGGCPVEYPGEILDAATGVVTAFLDPEIGVPYPGISNAEFGVFDQSGRLVMSNRFWLVVEPGLFSINPQAMPSLRLSAAEIRLALRDNDPAEHNLIDTVLFTDAEIAMAICDPVDYWNEALPPLTKYTVENFPYRYNWKLAACSRLYSMVAQYYRDNHLPYSSQGGQAVDDMAKAPEYDRKAKELWDDYKAWVMNRKAAENITSFFGEVVSPYSHAFYW